MTANEEATTTPTQITPGPNAVDISPKQDGGVLKEIIKEGEGEAFPVAGCTVFIDYVGKLTDGTVFDSSKNYGEKIEFVFGRETVIKGWEIGVGTMKKGEVAILTCSPKYAYGNSCPWQESIPPDSTLIFEITLLDWTAVDYSPCQDGGILKVETIVHGKKYSTPVDRAQVEVHIVGKYEDKVFEDRDVKFNLGEGCEEGVVEGIERALKKFRKGEKSVLEIKPKYAFKEEGNAELGVPPNATVRYTVELKNFERPQMALDMTPEERIAQAKLFKEKATNYFKANKYPLAVKFYNQLAEFVNSNSGFDNDNTELEEERESLLLAAKLNLGLVYLKMNECYEAKIQCDKALEISPKNVKALYRRGQAFLAMNEPEKAKIDFEAILEIEPSNKLAVSQIAACCSKIKQQREKEKKMYANMFDKFAKRDKEDASTYYGWWDDEKKEPLITEVKPLDLEGLEEAREEKRKQLEHLRKLAKAKREQMLAEKEEGEHGPEGNETVQEGVANTGSGKNEEATKEKEDEEGKADEKEKSNEPREPDAMKVLGEWGRDEREREPTEFEQENPDILMLNNNDQFKNM